MNRISMALAVGGLLAVGVLLSGGVSQADSSKAPAVLPPGGAGILTWTPEQQEWGYKNM